MFSVRSRVLFCSSNIFPACVGFAHRLFQDDDYLILPEVIQTLHARVMEHDQLSAVYLLPPHERISSDLHAVSRITGLCTRHFRG
jgi:hypothetical protein